MADKMYSGTLAYSIDLMALATERLSTLFYWYEIGVRKRLVEAMLCT
jgi:hypothetical protein